MPDHPKRSFETCMKALEGTHGNIAAIARRMGTARAQVYRYFNHYPEFKEAVYEAKQELHDDLEYIFEKDLLDGTAHHTERRFYFETQMRNRGYGKESTNPEINIQNSTALELQLEQALDKVYGS